MSNVNPVWSKLRFFQYNSKVDNWGDPSKMNPELLLKLDDFRAAMGIPVVVTSGTGGVHETNSQHYDGNAVDVMLPTMRGSLFDAFLMAERFNFTGIGIYRDWLWKGHKLGGLHLDVRPLQKEADGTLQYLSNRWIGIEELQGGKTVQVYYPFTLENLKKYAFI